MLSTNEQADELERRARGAISLAEGQQLQSRADALRKTGDRNGTASFHRTPLIPN